MVLIPLLSWSRSLCIAAIAFAAVSSAQAADPVRGRALFFQTNAAPLSCGTLGCHDGFPGQRKNAIDKGANPTVIQNAINSNKGGMGILAGHVNTTDLADIAAYISNPAAGTGAPTISLTAPSLTFASQTVGTSSAPQLITVSNTGTAALSITALTLGGAAAADFARAGTCSAGMSIAVGASCSIQVTFMPTLAGARAATLTVAHNATGGSSTIALNGTATPTPAAATVEPATLTFTQQVGSTSVAQTATLTNSGGSPLTINAIALAGTSMAEYAIATGGTCAAGTVVNGGASCTVPIIFTPSALGVRNATLSITHSASANALAVTLNGSGVSTPQPSVSLSTNALTFAAQAVGMSSATQTVTLTNSGQAALSLSAITLGGSAAGDFTRSGTCAPGTPLAAGANCTLQLAFAPTAVGARSAVLTIASNAANGAAVVNLSGTGEQVAMSISPTSAALQAVVGAMSAPVQAVISNSGQSALTVTAVTVEGPFVLSGGTNACSAPPISLAAGQSCNLFVAFQPAAEGLANGAVLIASNAGATPARVTLTATASAPVSNPSTPGSAGSMPGGSNLGAGGCSAGAPDQLFDPLLALMLAVAMFEILRRRNRRERPSR